MPRFFALFDGLRHRLRRPRLTPAHALGRRAEDLAHRHLERAGLRVVGRNFRTLDGRGEVDLVAREGETLVFVEVKARSAREFGAPDRAIDPFKMDALRRAARAWLQASGRPACPVRFDVVTVVLDGRAEIGHVRDCFAARSGR